jgi:putative intracellular protease/amidase
VKEATEMLTGKGVKRILIVVANPSVSTTTGWPVGFWASELTHIYKEFTDRGYEVTIASPKGGKVQVDTLSDPRDESGYSKDDTISLEYLENPEFVKILENTPKITDFSTADFDAIVVVGGQSPMFTFKEETGLQNKFKEFYDSGRISAALCHGTSLLLYLRNNKGIPVIKGKKMTGFTSDEEDFVDKTVGQKVMPFRIEDEAKKQGANFVKAEAFKPYAVRDRNLITGQQQNSGKVTAELVIKALEE